MQSCGGYFSKNILQIDLGQLHGIFDIGNKRLTFQNQLLDGYLSIYTLNDNGQMLHSTIEGKLDKITGTIKLTL